MACNIAQRLVTRGNDLSFHRSGRLVDAAAVGPAIVLFSVLAAALAKRDRLRDPGLIRPRHRTVRVRGRGDLLIVGAAVLPDVFALGPAVGQDRPDAGDGRRAGGRGRCSCSPACIGRTGPGPIGWWRVSLPAGYSGAVASRPTASARRVGRRCRASARAAELAPPRPVVMSLGSSVSWAASDRGPWRLLRHPRWPQLLAFAMVVGFGALQPTTAFYVQDRFRLDIADPVREGRPRLGRFREVCSVRRAGLHRPTPCACGPRGMLTVRSRALPARHRRRPACVRLRLVDRGLRRARRRLRLGAVGPDARRPRWSAASTARARSRVLQAVMSAAWIAGALGGTTLYLFFASRHRLLLAAAGMAFALAQIRR